MKSPTNKKLFFIFILFLGTNIILGLLFKPDQFKRPIKDKGHLNYLPENYLVELNPILYEFYNNKKYDFPKNCHLNIEKSILESTPLIYKLKLWGIELTEIKVFKSETSHYLSANFLGSVAQLSSYRSTGPYVISFTQCVDSSFKQFVSTNIYTLIEGAPKEVFLRRGKKWESPIKGHVEFIEKKQYDTPEGTHDFFWWFFNPHEFKKSPIVKVSRKGKISETYSVKIANQPKYDVKNKKTHLIVQLNQMETELESIQFIHPLFDINLIKI